MNYDILVAVGTIVITPLVTLLTLWIKDKNNLDKNNQAHQFDKENQLIKVLQDDITELKKQVKDLTNRLDTKNTEIRDIQSKLNSREIDYGNLIKDHAQLTENHQKLQLEHNTLKKQYDDTVEKLETLTKDYEELKKKSVEAAVHMITPK